MFTMRTGPFMGFTATFRYLVSCHGNKRVAPPSVRTDTEAGTQGGPAWAGHGRNNGKPPGHVEGSLRS